MTVEPHAAELLAPVVEPPSEGTIVALHRLDLGDATTEHAS